MERYKILEHTADAKFQAFGHTLEEAFTNAALATAALMWDWKKVRKNVRFPIEVTGKDLEQLLSHFLEEIIYLLETRLFLIGSVENITIQKIEKFKNDRQQEKDKEAGKEELKGTGNREWERKVEKYISQDEKAREEKGSEEKGEWSSKAKEEDEESKGKFEEAYRLQAVFLGDNFFEDYEIYGGVKAITYNEMKIEQKDDLVTVQVVVDM